MKFKKFLEVGSHFCNFTAEQLEEMFDQDAINDLSELPLYQEGVFLLSQVLVGNNSEPIEALLKMDVADRRRILWSWIDILEDTSSLKHISRTIVNLI